MPRCLIGVLAVAAVVIGAVDATASSFFAGSAASETGKAPFAISGSAGSRLVAVLLTNIDPVSGASGAQYSHETLTGLFFNLGSTPFTPLSASVAPGSTGETEECTATSCEGSSSGESYSGGWARSGYSPGSAHLPGGFGIAASSRTSSPGDTDAGAAIEGAVRFVLEIPAGFETPEISDLSFTPGELSGRKNLGGGKNGRGPSGSGSGDPTDTRPSVPEPAILSLLGLALAGAAYRLRRVKSS